MFVYQPTFINWRSKVLYSTKLTPINNDLLPNIVYFNRKLALPFDSAYLIIDQNKCIPKIINVYIVYDLDYWPKGSLRNCTLQNGLSGATNIVKNEDQEKFVYTGCGIAFYGKSEWSLGNYSTRNIVTFWVDNSASSHAGNLKNEFLILGEGPTFVINESFSTSEKKFGINVIKAKRKFCLSFHYDADNSYLFTNGKGIYKFKASNKNNSFPYRFRLRTISNEFTTLDLGEASFVGNMYGFSVDYKSTEKCHILNIHKYSILKNNI